MERELVEVAMTTTDQQVYQSALPLMAAVCLDFAGALETTGHMPAG
jgi:hypothetical protein